MLLLEDYRTNSTSVNTMIIKFLERVMNEKLGAFLFHVLNQLLYCDYFILGAIFHYI